MDPLILMYDWVRRTREVLFEYTDSLPNEVYTLEHPNFAYGSIRNIHAHVAGCYQFWVGTMGLRQTISYVDEPASSLPDAKSMRAAFAKVDLMLEEAFTKFQNLDEPLEVVRPGRDVLIVSQRWLITHPITTRCAKYQLPTENFIGQRGRQVFDRRVDVVGAFVHPGES